jgi:hypothetical protein
MARAAWGDTTGDELGGAAVGKAFGGDAAVPEAGIGVAG